MPLIPFSHESQKSVHLYPPNILPIFTLLSALYTCRSWGIWDDSAATSPSMTFKSAVYLTPFPCSFPFHQSSETRSSSYLKRIPITSSWQIQLYTTWNINLMSTIFLTPLASRNMTQSWSSSNLSGYMVVLLHNDHMHCPGLYLAPLFILRGLEGLLHSMV